MKQRIAKQDGLIFLQDSIFKLLTGVACGDLMELAQACAIYVLNDELEIRGISQHELIAGIKVIDYPAFVALTAEYTGVCSWT